MKKMYEIIECVNIANGVILSGLLGAILLQKVLEGGVAWGMVAGILAAISVSYSICMSLVLGDIFFEKDHQS